MKKRLAVLWVAWLLAWWPNADAQIDSTKIETNKDLIETINQNKSENWSNIISFEDAKRFQEQKEFSERILKNEKIQELIEEYWQESVEKIVNEIIINEININEDIKELIETALKDGDIQKALEEWNEENLIKFVEEVTKDFDMQSKWLRVIDKVCFGIIFIIVWENLKKK